LKRCFGSIKQKNKEGEEKEKEEEEETHKEFLIYFFLLL